MSNREINEGGKGMKGGSVFFYFFFNVLTASVRNETTGRRKTLKIQMPKNNLEM